MKRNKSNENKGKLPLKVHSVWTFELLRIHFNDIDLGN